MTKPINVISLFDGMSCGRLALKKLSVPVGKYIASEIDKHAIKVAKTNFPDTVHMGSVTDIDYSLGEVYSFFDVEEMPKADLFIGGSPCQSFSFAGSRKGMVTKDNVEILTLEHYLQLKQDGFEFQGQSYLFWEYVRLLKQVQDENPDVYFLLENVKMQKKWQDLISGVLGVEPIVINSALVSAQNRVRLYWTNIPVLWDPEDKGVLLKHIIDYSVPFTNVFDPTKTKYEPSVTNGVITFNPKKVDGTQTYQQDRIYADAGKIIALSAELSGRFNIAPFVDRDKSYALDASYYKGVGASPDLYFDKSRRQLVFAEVRPASIVGRRINENGVRDDYNKDVSISQTLEVQPGVKSRCLTTVEKDCLLSLEEPGRYPDAYNRPELLWRKLTPVECERLQTVPDNYTACVSNSQRYRMLGNGWTVDVIAHILSFIEWQ